MVITDDDSLCPPRLFEPTTGLIQVSPNWYRVSRVNREAASLYRRHYTHPTGRVWGGTNSYHFVGPGEAIVLITRMSNALFVWRKERYRIDSEVGVNCAVFRNEGPKLSSLLVREACSVAWTRWPGERLFTFVNSQRIKSSNPGYCFKKAGWRQCDYVTKIQKLTVLEIAADAAEG